MDGALERMGQQAQAYHIWCENTESPADDIVEGTHPDVTKDGADVVRTLATAIKQDLEEYMSYARSGGSRAGRSGNSIPGGARRAHATTKRKVKNGSSSEYDAATAGDERRRDKGTTRAQASAAGRISAIECEIAAAEYGRITTGPNNTKVEVAYVGQA